MFHAGQEIGIYTLIQPIGRGGFGEVWLAERRAKFVTTKVAVKLPHDEQIDHEAIKHEAQLWEQASGHPNVLPIIDADEYDGQIVIVSEYAPDGSLEQWLRTHGKMPIEKAVKTTIQILDGLEFLHSRNIIHRDLKPANILLQGDTPRLADFGISRALQTTATSQSQNISGTFAYMSPEALDGRRSIQTDIWSVGVNLYRFMTGTLPFPQKEPSALLAAIMTREYQSLPPDVPNNLQNLIAKTLAKHPVNRYKTAGEMREDLSRILLGKSVSPQTLPEIETVIKPIVSPISAPPQNDFSQSPLADTRRVLRESVPIRETQKLTATNSISAGFIKLFIFALIIVGLLILFIKYSENLSEAVKNISKVIVPQASPVSDISENSTSSNIINSNKNLITPSPVATPISTPKNKPVNANLPDDANSFYGAQNNEDRQIETTQSRNSNNSPVEESNQSLPENLQTAAQQLQNKMLESAQAISISRHKSSRIEECYTSDITEISQTLFSILYRCQMKGKILGVRKFEVGVKITGEITTEGNIFKNRIVNLAIIYDKEL